MLMVEYVRLSDWFGFDCRNANVEMVDLDVCGDVEGKKWTVEGQGICRHFSDAMPRYGWQ